METPRFSLRLLMADRFFRIGVPLLAIFVALYAGVVCAAWAKTPLGQHPKGEAASWLAAGEAMHDGSLPREPFFRSPLYISILSLLRNFCASPSGLADAARGLNVALHVLATLLVALIAARVWNSGKAGVLAAALWGFFPAAVFLCIEAGPVPLALLLWLLGVACALAAIRRPLAGIAGLPGSPASAAWAVGAGLLFAVAASLSASLWPVALAWPAAAFFFSRESRGVRFTAGAVGMGIVVLLLGFIQHVWGGSPQPLPGADLYQLSRALEITRPFAAPLPAMEIREDRAPDPLQAEAILTYPTAGGQPAPLRAIVDGYWWRRALREFTHRPKQSLIRAGKKSLELLRNAEHFKGPMLARAKGEVFLLRINPLGWAVVLGAGMAGLALGRKIFSAWMLFSFGLLAVVGALAWYPIAEYRAPVAALLCILAGALATPRWPAAWGGRLGVAALFAVLATLSLWPREDTAQADLSAIDDLRRALALADTGQFNKALSELNRNGDRSSFAERELAAEWQFAQLMNSLPALPARGDLELQLLENAEIAGQSRAAQFRSGVYLWLLERHDGALYFWRELADGGDEWGLAAREAVKNSGLETSEEASRRAAWEIGAGARTDSLLRPFLNRLRPAAAGSN